MPSRLCYFFFCNFLLCEVNSQYYLKSSIEFNPPKDFQNISSYFGYSIAYQAGSKRLLIGAPRADNEGKVFECSLQNRLCKQIKINIASKRIDPQDSSFYEHDFLLGVNIASGSNFSVTCAPRVSDTRITSSNGNHLGSFGSCYVILDSNDFGLQMEKFKVPEIKNKFRNIESLMDIYGWSLFVSNDDSILVGSPAFNEGFLRYDNFITQSQHIKRLFLKTEKPDHDFAYSVIRGNFDNSKDNMIAASAPIKESYGMVYLMHYINDDLKIETTINGETLGSLFGACLCAADIDGDGLDELIVGAPLYASHISDEIDKGVFYVYKNAKTKAFKLTKDKTIIGSKNGGYFGNAIIKVGDLDGDGCQEIAVGAPYEDDGHGAVYLYSGPSLKNDGSGKYIQRIASENLMSFGFSLNVLSDYDDNGCNELVIGAPESNTVVLFNCFASIEVKLNDIQLPLNATNMKLLSCFDVVHPPKPVNKIATIRVTVRLIHMHAQFVRPNNGSFYQYLTNITEANHYCEKIDIYMPKEGDYSNPIHYNIRAELLYNPLEMMNYDPNRVLLSPNSRLMKPGSISTERTCKGKCIHKLQMEVFTPKNNTIASLRSEFININVTSLGDPPSSPCVILEVSDVAISTYPKECVKSKDYLICKPGIILNNGVVWNTGRIKIEMKDLTSSNKVLNITAKLSNKCDNFTDYTSNRLVYLNTDHGKVFVRSTSDHEDIRLTSLDIFNKTNFKIVNHIYTITNSGQTIWTNLKGKITIQPNISNAFKILKEPLGILDMKTFALPKLDRSNKLDVIVPIAIQTKLLDGIVTSKNLTLKTTLTVFLDGHSIISNSSENVIYFQKNVKVPLWIILAAVLAGIILVILLIVLLNKMGCFGRKNKKKLEKLKNDIKRQSMRQSMILVAREALRSTNAATVSTENIISESSYVQEDNTHQAQVNEPETKKDC